MKKIIISLFIVSFVLVGCSLPGDKPKQTDSGVINSQQQEIEKLKNEIDSLKNSTSSNKILEPIKEETKKATSTPAQVPPKKTTLSDLGDFKIMYGATQNPQYTGMNEVIKKSGVFENATAALNMLLVLPKDFPIVFQECGTVNAFYNPQEDGIIICNELLENFGQNFVYFVKTESELDVAITDATYFILYHELGHGLIDIYDLNYSGREEDVVDQLSTLLLTLAGEAGARAAVTGASFFYLTSTQSDVSDFPFWDEHALDQQRFYNILCWVYGSNPQKYGDLVSTGKLPQPRAVQCQREYQKISDFWDIAIYSFLQEDIKKIMEQEGTAPK